MKKSNKKKKSRALVNRPRRWMEFDGGVCEAREALTSAQKALENEEVSLKEAQDETKDDKAFKKASLEVIRLCLEAQYKTWDVVASADEQASLLSQALTVAKRLEHKWPQMQVDKKKKKVDILINAQQRTVELERQRRIDCGRLSLQNLDGVLEEHKISICLTDWDKLKVEESDLILARLAHREWSSANLDEGTIEDIRRRCEIAVRRSFREAKCEVYGSRRSGLAHSQSDVDICALVDAPEVDVFQVALRTAYQEQELNDDVIDDLCLKLSSARSKQAYRVRTCLEKAGFNNVIAIPWARVPVVKATDVKSHLTLDVVVNNQCAVRNSQLLKRFAETHKCAKTLILLVKLWAKARQVDDAQYGTLSSYAHALLAIFSLQTAGLLPPAQVFFRDDGTMIPPPLTNSVKKKSTDTPGLAKLLKNYFTCVASIDAMACTVSVRLGKLIAKTEWLSAVGRTRDPLGWRLSIEDPLEHVRSSRPRDLGDVLTSRGEKKLRSEVGRALRLISSNDWLTLFQADATVHTDGDSSSSTRDVLPPSPCSKTDFPSLPSTTETPPRPYYRPRSRGDPFTSERGEQREGTPVSIPGDDASTIINSNEESNNNVTKQSATSENNVIKQQRRHNYHRRQRGGRRGGIVIAKTSPSNSNTNNNGTTNIRRSNQHHCQVSSPFS